MSKRNGRVVAAALVGVSLAAGMPAEAGLLHLNWVLVANSSTYPPESKPPALLGDEFLTRPGAQTWELRVETTAADRFLSADIDIAGHPIFSWQGVGPPTLATAFPNSAAAFSTYVRGPQAAGNVQLNASTLSSNRLTASWTYQPPVGQEVNGGRHPLMRLTFDRPILAAPTNHLGTLRLASDPSTAIPIPPAGPPNLGEDFWTRPTSGVWDDAYNWNGMSIGRLPVFGGTSSYDPPYPTLAPAGPVTVTVEAPEREVLGMTFRGAQPFTVEGDGLLTLQTLFFNVDVRLLAEGASPHRIEIPVQVSPTHGDDHGLRLEVRAPASLELADLRPLERRVRKSGDGIARISRTATGPLLVEGGTLQLTRGDAAAVAPSLAVADGAELRVGSGGLVLDYPAAGPSPLATHVGDIVAGRIAAGFDGGVVGSAEAAALGVDEFLGRPVDGSAILLRGTLAGDANLDGTVDIADFGRLAANFNLAGTWLNGDFDYSGVTDIADFSLLAGQFNQTVSGDRAGPGAAVPEPAAALGAIVLMLGTSRRVRR